MAYADVSDLESRWRDLSADEEAKAAVLLDDASAMLASYVDVDESDEAQMTLLKIVCCNMVQRSMSATESDLYGVTQQSMSAVGFSQSMSYSNPTGDMYLTKSEKRLLGINAGYVTSIRPMMAGDHDD